MYFQKYMHGRNLCMSETYASKKYTNAGNICMPEIYVRIFKKI